LKVWRKAFFCLDEATGKPLDPAEALPGKGSPGSAKASGGGAAKAARAQGGAKAGKKALEASVGVRGVSGGGSSLKDKAGGVKTGSAKAGGALKGGAGLLKEKAGSSGTEKDQVIQLLLVEV
jgi:hypothetical protein